MVVALSLLATLTAAGDSMPSSARASGPGLTVALVGPRRVRPHVPVRYTLVVGNRSRATLRRTTVRFEPGELIIKARPTPQISSAPGSAHREAEWLTRLRPSSVRSYALTLKFPARDPGVRGPYDLLISAQGGSAWDWETVSINYR